MWSLIYYFFWLIKCVGMEIAFFYVVDTFTKTPLREATNDSEMRAIWLCESAILLAVSAVVYWTDHTPYVLLILTSITCLYTQLNGRVDVQRMWTWWRTWWEEYQQHEESMRQLQAQQVKQQATAPVPGTALVPSTLSTFPPPTPVHSHILPTRGYPPNVTLHPGQNVPAQGTSLESPPGLTQKYLSGGNAAFQGTSMTAPSHAGAQVAHSRPGVVLSGMSLLKDPPKVFQGAGQAQRGGCVGTSSRWVSGELTRRPLHQSAGAFRVSPSLGFGSRAHSAVQTRSVSVVSAGDPSYTLPPGLTNKGQNLCFINSVLQCLARSPYLAHCLTADVAKKLECTVSESLLLSKLAELLDLLTAKPDSVDSSVLDTLSFRQAASALSGSLIAPLGQPQQQQDAAEFLMWLLDTVHSILNKNRKALSCGADTGAKDRFSDAQLTKLKRIYGDLTPSAGKALKEECLRTIELANGLEDDSYAEAIQRLSDLEWLLHKQSNESIVDTLFTGQLVEVSMCLSNKRISVALQTFNLLPLPLTTPCHVSGLVLLEDCFTSFCHIEHMVNPGAAATQNACPTLQQAQRGDLAGSPATTPQMMTKMRGNVRSSEADSAFQSSFSRLSSAMSPIVGQPEFVNDSGFCDNVFKTSTPIRESVRSKTVSHTGDVQRRCLLRQLPQCLIIQVKRFCFNTQLGCPTKLHAPLSVHPRGLDLHPLVYDTVMQREDLTASSGASGSQKYDLYGLCLHLGAQRTNHGHYVSYCLCADNHWYRFDDDKVTRVNIEYELTTPEVRQNAYLLFYKCAVS